MADVCNLVVELDDRFELAPIDGVEMAGPAPADERTLAWIDDTFGGSWSSQARAGSTIIARQGGAPIGFAALEPKGLRYAWLRDLARESGTGVLGPFGVAPHWRRRGLGRELLVRALDSLRKRNYVRALICAVCGDRLMEYLSHAAGARVAERFEQSTLYRRARRALIFASGNGSNFQAVLDASRRGELPVEIVGLLTNNRDAFAIERARRGGLESVHVRTWNRKEETRAAYDAALVELAKAQEPDLVLLLGWMHLLSDSFLAAFPDIVNLHPAFLPLDPARDEVVMPDGEKIAAFRGPRAVEDALSARSSWTGATLHRVTAVTDRGPVLARRPLRIDAGEEEAALMERVHELERSVVQAGVLRWLFER